jgi:hypothetical protein
VLNTVAVVVELEIDYLIPHRAEAGHSGEYYIVVSCI